MPKKFRPALLVCLVFSWVFAISLFDALPAHGGSTISEKERFIQALGEQVIEIINSDDLSRHDQFVQAEEMFAANFDLNYMARFTIGPYWKTLDDADQQRFVALFRKYFPAVYLSSLTGYALGKFEVLGEHDMRELGTVVSTSYTRTNGPPVRIDFQLRDAGDEFKIFDVVFEGVSLLVAKRAEFLSVIMQSGMPRLFDALQTKIAKWN